MSKQEKESSVDDSVQEELDLVEQVEKAIKELPNLDQKIQVIALNTFLIEKRNLDVQLEKQTQSIEVKHRQQYQPHLTQIKNIVSGKFDFKDQDFVDIGDLLSPQELEVKHNYFTKEPIPQYWLKVLINSQVGDQITEKDEPLLRHLQGIDAQKTEDGNKLTVVFQFTQNEWFTNLTLKKQFDLDGQNIKKSYGDKIEWKEGKNITVKIVKKKQKNKKTGEKKTKVVRQQSFFNFFRDIEINSDDDDNDSKEQKQNDNQQKQIEQLEQQYQTANSLYEELIPRSLEYYLGVMSGMDFPDEGLQDIDEEDQSEQDEPKKKNKSKNRKNRKQSTDSK